MGKMPLAHLLDSEVRPPGADEPKIAPISSYELLWRKLAKKYKEDCKKIEETIDGPKAQRINPAHPCGLSPSVWANVFLVCCHGIFV